MIMLKESVIYAPTNRYCCMCIIQCNFLDIQLWIWDLIWRFGAYGLRFDPSLYQQLSCKWHGKMSLSWAHRNWMLLICNIFCNFSDPTSVNSCNIYALGSLDLTKSVISWQVSWKNVPSNICDKIGALVFYSHSEEQFTSDGCTNDLWEHTDHSIPENKEWHERRREDRAIMYHFTVPNPGLIHAVAPNISGILHHLTVSDWCLLMN
jgi:hypothetical protein